MKLTAYSVKLRKTVEIANPKVVIMKNGRRAAQGVAAEDPTSKVFRIHRQKEADQHEKELA